MEPGRLSVLLLRLTDEMWSRMLSRMAATECMSLSSGDGVVLLLLMVGWAMTPKCLVVVWKMYCYESQFIIFNL